MKPILLRWLLWLALLFLGYVAFFALLGAALERYFLLAGFGPERAASAGRAMAEGAEITLKLTLISGLAGLVIGVLTGMAGFPHGPWCGFPPPFTSG
jgi:polar amino acid transport system permease protein